MGQNSLTTSRLERPWSFLEARQPLGVREPGRDRACAALLLCLLGRPRAPQLTSRGAGGPLPFARGPLPFARGCSAGFSNCERHSSPSACPSSNKIVLSKAGFLVDKQSWRLLCSPDRYWISSPRKSPRSLPVADRPMSNPGPSPLRSHGHTAACHLLFTGTVGTAVHRGVPLRG